MRNPNGYGTVYKLSGKRRRPYIARVTTGWEIIDGKEKQIIQTIGYYATRAEAMNALSKFNMNPYDIKSRQLTLAQVYEMWLADPVGGGSASKNVLASSRTCWKHCAPLHDVPMKDITVAAIENLINGIKATSPKVVVRVFLNKLYKYALRHDIVEKNTTTLIEIIPPSDESTKLERRVISDAEEAALWAMSSDKMAMIILICMYSGWRIAEITSLKLSDINFDSMTMTGGVKTGAGKNRVVPIHPKISGLLHSLYDMASSRGSSTLCFSGRKTPRLYNYTQFRREFDSIFEKIGGAAHTPHDTRHTFITKAKEAGVNEYILKLIVGHSISDLTERVYTHRKIEELRTEIEKIK